MTVPVIDRLDPDSAVSLVQQCVDGIQEVKDTCVVALRDAPERPDETCPDINEAIRVLKIVAAEICAAHSALDEHDLTSPFNSLFPDTDIDTVIDLLEDLRKANAALRKNGTYFYEAITVCMSIADSAVTVWRR